MLTDPKEPPDLDDEDGDDEDDFDELDDEDEDELEDDEDGELDEDDDENAAGYYNICRSKGVQGTATDLLICAIAVRHGMRIFTTDTDFNEFAKHLPIDLHTVRGRK